MDYRRGGRMSNLHMDLCLREGVFDTPMIHDKRSKQQIS